MSEDKQKAIPVKVALRIRPLIPREVDDGCQSCIHTVSGEPQVILGQDRPFTYDYVFGPSDPQTEVYEQISKELLQSVFKGINATVLAYGQTGSGKTFTMGGCYNSSLSGDEIHMGVIPRVLKDIFREMEERQETEFSIRVSYMEIYNEEVFDLLCPPNQRDSLSIKEEANGGIKICGLRELSVNNFTETLGLLCSGSVGRTTGATAMNSTSSRSHAVFTLHMEQRNKEDANDICMMKFQLVDLAGSERCKRTGAEGDRFKEGVNINKGLLVLGNVISALGKKQSHIPYRDAKLTRLLQDSLGGNSHTVMIACVSPADTNIEETLNTLRYADRARKIKNKPVINRDPHAAEIMRLKMLVQQLQCQLMGGVSSSTLQSESSTISSSIATVDNSAEEIRKLTDENKKFKDESKKVKDENLRLTYELHESLQQRTQMVDSVLAMEARLERVKNNVGIDIDLLSASMNADSNPKVKAELDKLCKLTESIKEEDEVPAEDDDPEEENESMDDNKPDHSQLNSADRATAQEHLLKHADLHRQLTDLTAVLKEKQTLAEKMNQADDEMESMKTRYNKLMEEWQEKVKDKQQEIDELKNTQSNTKQNVTKLSEQRRQRLQQLEGEIQQLKKKMTEQNKVLKLKQKSDSQVSKLNTEITAMKQQRVRLIKQMKEETTNFQKWKKEKDQEVNKLRLKDTKREYQLKKLQNEFDKQQNVLKRKNTEAIAANKRLRDALSKRHAIEAEKTSKLVKNDATSIGNRVRKWLSHELELKFSMRECKFHLEELMENRKCLTQRLQLLSKELEEGPLTEKFSWLGDAGDPEEISMHEEEIKKQMNAIQMDIDMINMQIEELQQKIVETDQDLKGKCTWQSLHTMTEAKCALKFLLEQAVNAKTEHSKTTSELKNAVDHGKVEEGEMESRINEMQSVNRDLKASVSQLKSKHERAMDKLRNEYEEKVLFLLNADHSHKGTPKGTPKSSKVLDAASKEKLKLLESQVRNMEDMSARLMEAESQLESKQKECEDLQRNMTCEMYQNKKFKLMPDVDSGSSPFINPTLKKTGDICSIEEMPTLDSTFTVEDEVEAQPAPPPPPCPNTVTIKPRSRFTRSNSELKLEKVEESNMSVRNSSNISLDLENSGLMKRKSGDDPADNLDNSRERKKKRKRTLLSQDISFFGNLENKSEEMF